MTGNDTSDVQRQPAFNVPGSLLCLVALCVIIHMLRISVLGTEADRLLLVNFAFIPLRYVASLLTIDVPTIMSPVSYSFLHGGWLHLGLNMIWLVAFGSPVAWRLGWPLTYLFWAVTAICAAAFHALLYWGDPVPLIGASGAVSGFMGAAARFGFRTNRVRPRLGFSGPRLSIAKALSSPPILGFLIIWMVVNYLAGAGVFGMTGESTIAWEAHIGGLVAGFLLIGLFDRKRR